MASTQDATFVCITDEELPENGHINKRYLYAFLCLASAVLGFAGAAWQIWVWGKILWRKRKRRNLKRSSKTQPGGYLPNADDARTNTSSDSLSVSGSNSRMGGRNGRQGRSKSTVTIVFYLAVANAMACVGSAVRAISVYCTSPANITDPANTADDMCHSDTDVVPTVSESVIIASIFIDAFTNYAYTAGWLWTLAYAADVCRQTHSLARTFLLPQTPCTRTYTWLCWGVPLPFLLAYFCLTTLHLPDRCPGKPDLIGLYTAGYLPLLVVMVAIPVLLSKSRRDARRILVQQTAAMTNAQRHILTSQSHTFVAMVIIFLLCWLPNIADACLQLYFFRHCDIIHTAIMGIWITEAVLNPLQGLINCVLYGQLCGLRQKLWDRPAGAERLY